MIKYSLYNDEMMKTEKKNSQKPKPENLVIFLIFKNIFC